MKIFYAVQATGNGHISRAMQLLPHLKRYGTVDVFLSGANSQLSADLPVRYRSKGLSLFYNKGGGLDYATILKNIHPLRLWREMKELPVENYDVVINDFDCVTSLACAHKKVASIGFGHQASFHSPLVPRPAKKQLMGEWILNHYASATSYIGLHFERYADFILTPVIKKEVLLAKPTNKKHITVYLSSYNDELLLQYFGQIKGFHFHVFSKHVQSTVHQGNVTFFPVNDRMFTESMIGSAGVITGAGFETPAEALHLQKKLMVIPIRGQYEQSCNAAALERLGVTVLTSMDKSFCMAFDEWMQDTKQQMIHYNDIAPLAIKKVIENYPYRSSSLDLLYPNLIFN